MNTAQASLRQVILQLFERIPVEQDNTSPAFTDAFSVFQDVCLLANGDSPRFLQTTVLSMEFGLELIETVVGTFVDVFRKVSKSA